jgi:hypothetical protein
MISYNRIHQNGLFRVVLSGCRQARCRNNSMVKDGMDFFCRALSSACYDSAAGTFGYRNGALNDPNGMVPAKNT